MKSSKACFGAEGMWSDNLHSIKQSGELIKKQVQLNNPHPLWPIAGSSHVPLKHHSQGNPGVSSPHARLTIHVMILQQFERRAERYADIFLFTNSVPTTSH